MTKHRVLDEEWQQELLPRLFHANFFNLVLPKSTTRVLLCNRINVGNKIRTIFSLLTSTAGGGSKMKNSSIGGGGWGGGGS
jgi:hypothetical protein